MNLLLQKKILPLLLFVLLAGCTVGKSGAFRSYAAGDFPSTHEMVIAEDLADDLSNIFPPGHTIIYLSMAASQDGVGQGLEQILRSRGFTLAVEPGGQAKTVAYVLDKVEDGYWYTRLTVSGGLTMTRVYNVSNDKVEAQASAMTDRGK